LINDHEPIDVANEGARAESGRGRDDEAALLLRARAPGHHQKAATLFGVGLGLRLFEINPATEAEGSLMIPGDRFGRLVVIADAGRSRFGTMLVDVACDCGTILVVRASRLLRGQKKSCGCLAVEAAARNAATEHSIDFRARGKPKAAADATLEEQLLFGGKA
jgi:hypothetical protein